MYKVGKNLQNKKKQKKTGSVRYIQVVSLKGRLYPSRLVPNKALKVKKRLWCPFPDSRIETAIRIPTCSGERQYGHKIAVMGSLAFQEGFSS